MSDTTAPDISFVIIGYNEGKHIRSCLESVRAINLPGARYEIIYVDGGSRDNSVEQARSVDGVRVLGGDRRRRAAENRNHGAEHALGRYIQFIDGDMHLDPEWPAIAMAFLDLHPEVGVVFGMLEETNPSFIFRVLQIDWNPLEGEADTCGGAAMHRREVFEAAGRFPEDVSTGEEPLLCWRVRSNTAHKIWYLHKRMAQHDLGYTSFRDYWKRCTTNGRAYIEIASRCWKTSDPFWKPNVIRNFTWAAIYIAAIITFILAPLFLKLALIALVALILIRLTIKTWRKGNPFTIAAGYALHCYFAKIPLAWGQLKWLLSTKP